MKLWAAYFGICENGKNNNHVGVISRELNDTAVLMIGAVSPENFMCTVWIPLGSLTPFNTFAGCCFKMYVVQCHQTDVSEQGLEPRSRCLQTSCSLKKKSTIYVKVHLVKPSGEGFLGVLMHKYFCSFLPTNSEISCN